MKNCDFIEWLRQFDQEAEVRVQVFGERYKRDLWMEDSRTEASPREGVPYTVVLSVD